MWAERTKEKREVKTMHDTGNMKGTAAVGRREKGAGVLVCRERCHGGRKLGANF